MNAADIRSAGNGYLDEYDEARRALVVLRKRLFDIGHSMMMAGSALKKGESVGSVGHPPTDLDTIRADLASFEATLDEYRQTRERAAAVYKCLVGLGRESIKDLSKFPEL